MTDTPEKKQVALIEDYKMVFGSNEGERVLNDMLDRYHILQPLNLKATIDHMDLAYNEGQRNVMLEILGKLGTDTMQLRKMIEQRYKQPNFGVIDDGY